MEAEISKEMTYEKAIEKLTEDCVKMESLCDCKGKCDDCHISMAIEALITQMPLYHEKGECPICGTSIRYYYIGFEGEPVELVRDKYCSRCGQAIDWSEE